MSKRVFAPVGNMMLFSGAVLFAVAMGLSLFDAAPPGELRLEPAERVVDGVPIRQDLTVRFIAINDTAATVRLVGSCGSCGPHGCIDGLGFPLSVAAGSDYEFGVKFKVMQPGPFEQVLPVYVDHPHLRTIPVTVRGTAVAAENDGPQFN